MAASGLCRTASAPGALLGSLSRGASLESPRLLGRLASGRFQAPGRTSSLSSRVQATSSRSPWDTLGVQRDASVPEVKRAYRKLVLKYHPDVSPESEPEEKFLELHDAYMTMIGKTQASMDPDAPPRDNNSWEFHDWYWSFSTNQRRRRSSNANFSKRPEVEQAASRAKVHQQLSHLKTRAMGRRRAGKSQASSPRSTASSPVYDPEDNDPWAVQSLSVDLETGEEVHPAWRASVDTSAAAADGSECARAEADEGSNDDNAQAAEAEAEKQQFENPYVYSHRPPGIGSSHLGSQLTGLKRRAGLKARSNSDSMASAAP